MAIMLKNVSGVNINLFVIRFHAYYITLKTNSFDISYVVLFRIPNLLNTIISISYDSDRWRL